MPHPIERLRWIARADGESAATVAAEAAFTLGELAAEEPAAVLTASRRLVERNPACGPLWWACASMVAADDPVETATRVAADLLSDTVPNRLADALRFSFTSTDALCATMPVDTLRQALARRGSYLLRLVADHHWLHHAVRDLGALADEVVAYDLQEVEAALDGAAALLVEPCLAAAGPAAGPAGGVILVEPASAAVAEQAARRSVPIWLVLATGRLLPPALAEAAASLAGDEVDRLDPSTVLTAVDASGIAPLDRALSRVECPPAPELAHRAARRR